MSTENCCTKCGSPHSYSNLTDRLTINTVTVELYRCSVCGNIREKLLHTCSNCGKEISIEMRRN